MYEIFNLSHRRPYDILEQELRLSDAFFEKDSSKLELIVKVKNCTAPKLLPISKSWDILNVYFC